MEDLEYSWWLFVQWINRDSPRLAPFCTRTSTSASGSFLSPSPRFGVEDSPNTGNDDVRLIIPEVNDTLKLDTSYIFLLVNFLFAR